MWKEPSVEFKRIRTGWNTLWIRISAKSISIHGMNKARIRPMKVNIKMQTCFVRYLHNALCCLTFHLPAAKSLPIYITEATTNWQNTAITAHRLAKSWHVSILFSSASPECYWHWTFKASYFQQHFACSNTNHLTCTGYCMHRQV